MNETFIIQKKDLANLAQYMSEDMTYEITIKEIGTNDLNEEEVEEVMLQIKEAIKKQRRIND